MPPEEIWGFSVTVEHAKSKKRMEREERGPWPLAALIHVTIFHPLPTLKDGSGLSCIKESNEFLTSWKWWCPTPPFSSGKTEKFKDFPNNSCQQAYTMSRHWVKICA